MHACRKWTTIDYQYQAAYWAFTKQQGHERHRPVQFLTDKLISWCAALTAFKM